MKLNEQGHVMDLIKEVAKEVKLDSYNVEFEDKGGVSFVTLTLKSGVKVPQELCTGWPQLLRGSLETLRTNSEKVKEVKEVPLTVAVLHKPTGKWTAADVQAGRVREYGEVVIESFKKIGPATASDFALIEVDWNRKHIEITRME